jgi:hypothetical protein
MMRDGPADGRVLMTRSLRSWWSVAALVAVVVLIATGCSNNSEAASSSTPTATIFVQNFKYNGVPSTLPAGVIVQLLFQNKESFTIDHEMIPVALPSGKTAQDVIDDAKSKGPESEDEWLHIGGDFGAISTGAGLVETLVLPPGNYVFACWQTGTQTPGKEGPPHAAKGMVSEFSVS